MPDEIRLKKCVVCDTEFDANSRNFGRGRQTYCGPKCRQTADNRRHYRRRNPPKSEAELQRICVTCGNKFTAHYSDPNALACSVMCGEARMNAERRRQAAERYDVLSQMECGECGTKFTAGKYASKSGPKAPKFCSPKCARRVAQRAHYQRTKRKTNPRLGAAIWQVARAKAIERDGGKCRVCGVEANHVHHAFHLTEAEMHDHSPDNLICLCGSCHSKAHDIRIGKEGDEVIISGLVFSLLGITKVRIA